MTTTDGTPRKGIVAALTSWRIGSIALLSLSSGMPLGLVTITIPFWLTAQGVDIKTVGLITAAQLPYGLKFVWSPVMDRLRPGFIGHRRAWVLICQVALAVLTFSLASQAISFNAAVVGALALLISFASASQDIAYDAYAVEVLHKDEHGAAVSVRSGMYIAGLRIAGHLAISVSPFLGFGLTVSLLAALYLLMLPVTLFAPDPDVKPEAPQTLRDAVWQPFVSFLGRPRALELMAFVIFFRLTDSLADALITPFLKNVGFPEDVIGWKRGLIGLFANIIGTFVGGIATQKLGISRTLWICAVLQPATNLGYVVVANAGINEPVLYAAIGVETITTGLTWGAFGVLLLRLTDKRFSATQYALFSSFVGLARTFMGPVAGVLVDALGWRDFFVITVPFALPGAWLLYRFCPWGTEPKEMSGDDFSTTPPGVPWPRAMLWGLGVSASVIGGVIILCTNVALIGVKLRRAGKAFDYFESLRTASTNPTDVISAVVFGCVLGLAIAAYLAAKGRPAHYTSSPS